MFPRFESFRMTDPVEVDLRDFREHSDEDVADPTTTPGMAIVRLFEAWNEDTEFANVPGDGNRILFSVNPPDSSTIVAMGFLYEMEIVGADVGCVEVECRLFVTSDIPGVADAIRAGADGFDAVASEAGRPKMRVRVRT